MKRLPVQHSIKLETEERKLPNGNVFYLPVSTLDISNKVDLSDDDQVIFGDFMSWIQNYNQYIVGEWDANVGGNCKSRHERHSRRLCRSGCKLMNHRAELAIHKLLEDVLASRKQMSMETIEGVATDIKDAMDRQFGTKNDRGDFKLRMSNIGKTLLSALV